MLVVSARDRSREQRLAPFLCMDQGEIIEHSSACFEAPQTQSSSTIIVLAVAPGDIQIYEASRRADAATA